MARNRVFYQSESVFAGPDGATGVHVDKVQGSLNLVEQTSNISRLQRIQSANYSFTIDRTDLNQFGELAAVDRIILTSPTVSMDFSYVLANMSNEHILGFNVSDDGGTSAIKNFLDKSKDERNYFIKTSKEGLDNIGDTYGAPDYSSNVNGVMAAGIGVIGVGNGFLTSYTAEGAVGDFPTASVSIEGLNMTFDSNISGNIIPAINPVDGSKMDGYNNYGAVEYVLPTGRMGGTGHQHNSTDLTSALRPGDVTFTLYKAGGGHIPPGALLEGLPAIGLIEDANLQSFSCSFDLTRTPIEKLGSRFAFSREIDFPITVTFTVDAIMGDLTTGNLADVIDADQNYDICVHLKGSDVNDIGDGNGKVEKARYQVKRAKLDSTEFTSDIGSNKSVSLTFSSQVGGPNQTDVGLFMSGVYS